MATAVARRASAAPLDFDEGRMRELVRFTARTLETLHPAPFGALIVHTKTGKRLMRATNAVMRECDPSSHAEVRTIRLACKKLKSPVLCGYALYSTCEPCPMCMANALWARLDRIVFGATIADANRHCLQIHIPASELSRRSDMPCVVDGPILRDLCYTLFTTCRRPSALGGLGRSVRANPSHPTERSMNMSHAAALASILGDGSRVITQTELVQLLSRDFYWYSPVLRKQLDNKFGDLVVQPGTTAEIQDVLRYAHA